MAVLIDNVAPMDADVIVVGAGLSRLVAAGELVERGKTVLGTAMVSTASAQLLPRFIVGDAFGTLAVSP